MDEFEEENPNQPPQQKHVVRGLSTRSKNAFGRMSKRFVMKTFNEEEELLDGKAFYSVGVDSSGNCSAMAENPTYQNVDSLRFNTFQAPPMPRFNHPPAIPRRPIQAQQESEGTTNKVFSDDSGAPIDSQPSADIEAHTPHPHHEEPQPTDRSEEKEWFSHIWSENGSTIYAIFIVMLAIVLYTADTFYKGSSVADTFNFFLITVEIVWLTFIHVDLSRFLNLLKATLKKVYRASKREGKTVVNQDEHAQRLPMYYGFAAGRHGGSDYLKIGAIVFFFGHIIHSVLAFGQKILYITDEDGKFSQCTSHFGLIISFMRPLLASYQLYTVTRYSNLIINRFKIAARFGLMHCIATSLSFWIYEIMQETLHSIFASKYKKPYDVNIYDLSLVNITHENCLETLKNQCKDCSLFSSINYGCVDETELTDTINNLTPYLYPFTIEYNILIVGVWILLLENIGHTERNTVKPSSQLSLNKTNHSKSNSIVELDCDSSSRGFFASLLMMVIVVVTIIIFVIFSKSQSSSKIAGQYINNSTELLLLLTLLGSVIYVMIRMRELDVVKQTVSAVDDIWLLLCLPCIFIYPMLSVIPAAIKGDGFAVTISVLQLIQPILQTPFISDGIRRCSNSEDLQNKKPGRQVVTFLVAANVAMWLLETFQIKIKEGNSAQIYFYGKEMWTILSHITLPLALFYRFHASVCLADMWNEAYKPDVPH